MITIKNTINKQDLCSIISTYAQLIIDTKQRINHLEAECRIQRKYLNNTHVSPSILITKRAKMKHEINNLRIYKQELKQLNKKLSCLN